MTMNTFGESRVLADAEVEEEFARLIDEAKRGEGRALGLLWREHNPHLVRFLISIGISEPEDLASETWISMARAIRTFEGTKRNFRMLLFHIARRRVTDHLRASYRRPNMVLGIEDDDKYGRTYSLLPGEGDLKDALDLLRLIPGAQAEVISLRILLGLDVSEVAEIVGRSEGAVRVLSHRGLTKLADILRHRRRNAEPSSGDRTRVGREAVLTSLRAIATAADAELRVTEAPPTAVEQGKWTTDGSGQ